MVKTRKSLWAAGFALLVCILLLLGTTFAWFTDSVSNRGNKIQAGNLSIALLQKTDTMSDAQEVAARDAGINVSDEYTDISDVPAPIFDYTLWEPGYTDFKVLGVKNTGTLALKYKLDIVANEDAGDLAKIIDVYVTTSETPIDTVPTSLDGMHNAGTLESLMNDNDGAAYGELFPEGTEGKQNQAYVAIALHMQEGAGNEYQNAKVGTSFDINLSATQLPYERDGFNSDQYDKEATFSVTSAKELSDAINQAQNGDIIAVTENIENDNIILNLTSNKDITVDLNGNTLNYTGTNRSVQLAYGANMTILDGTISMENITEEGAGIFIFGDTNSSNACKLTMKDVVVNSSALGVFSQGANNEIIIDGCTINSKYFGVYQNGSSSPATFTIKNSKIRDTKGTGIYISNSSANGRAKQTLNVENSTVSGPTAIEVKHTNATITDSILIGTATPTGSGENNNGSCTSGYAFAVTTNSAVDYVTGNVTVRNCKFYNGSTIEGEPNGYCFVYKVADGFAVTIDGKEVSDYNNYGGN